VRRDPEKDRRLRVRRQEAIDRLTQQAPPPTITPAGCPSGKAPYPTAAAVLERIRAMGRRARASSSHYRCQHCGAYHLTSGVFRSNFERR
jgi:hypothetical protein